MQEDRSDPLHNGDDSFSKKVILYTHTRCHKNMMNPKRKIDEARDNLILTSIIFKMLCIERYCLFEHTFFAYFHLFLKSKDILAVALFCF